MKEHPIIFSTEMVKAILEGRKTTTRRVITKHNSVIGEGGDWSLLDFEGKTTHKDNPIEFDLKWLGIHRQAPLPFVDGKPETSQYLHVPYNWEDDETIFRVYPKWKVGDRLWVKETWAEQGGDIYYMTDWDDNKPVNMVYDNIKWRSPRFMFRWASRILLEITEIRVARLQEITLEDCKAEGIHQYTFARACCSTNPPDPRWQFIELWDSLNAKRGYGWSKNPWVWVISFSKVIAPRN